MESRIGQIFENKKGQKAKIIEYNKAIDMTIMFEDGTIRYKVQYENIKRGSFNNRNSKSYYGVGFLGYGEYILEDCPEAKGRWVKMLKRCCVDTKKHINYKDVTVCEEWHNFQNYAGWFYQNWKEYMDKTWHLDKDILNKGNKIYSPEVCCFVPQEINMLFTTRKKSRGLYPVGVRSQSENRYTAYIRKYRKIINLGTYSTIEEAFEAYKVEKEKYIKEVADKWKDLIDPRVYEAMYNYEVEIDD